MKKDDRERALREESERAYQKWLKETGRTEELSRKKKERRFKMSRLVIMRYAGLCALFAVILVGLSALFSRMPNASALSPWVTSGLPLLVAWFAAAAVGRNVTSTRKAIALATVCLAVAALIYCVAASNSNALPSTTTTTTPPPTTTTTTMTSATTTQTGTTTTTLPTTTTTTTASSTETTTTTTTPPENTENVPPWSDNTLPENVPEDMVAFRFVSAFTYKGEEGSPSLAGVEVDLPWPHIGEQVSVGVPDDKLMPVEGWSRLGCWPTYPWELGSNSLSELIWLRLGLDKGGNVEFENIFENGSWSSSGTRYLNLPYLSEPGLGNENFMLKAMVKMVDQNRNTRDSLYPSETISIKGVFLVCKENAGSVRIGDLATEGLEWIPEENRWYKPTTPEQRKSPLASFGMPGTGFAENVAVLVQLERYENGAWTIVEKFYREFENLPFNHFFFVDIAT